MDRLLERHKLLKITQEETDNLNSPLYISKELEYVVKTLPTKKIPGSYDLTGEFYQTPKE